MTDELLEPFDERVEIEQRDDDQGRHLALDLARRLRIRSLRVHVEAPTRDRATHSVVAHGPSTKRCCYDDELDAFKTRNPGAIREGLF